MWKKILTMSLVLVMVLSFTTCGEGAEEAELPSAQEIVDGMIESFDNIQTYQFDVVITQDLAGEIEDEVIEQTVMIDISGALDLENVQMKIESTMNMVAPEDDEMEMGVEMYIVDDMMYAKPDAPGEEPVWMKSEVPIAAWEIQKGMSGLENHKKLLETAQVEVIGSEKVKGVDCYVLQLTPEMAPLWQTAMGPAGVGEGEVPNVPEELLEEVFSGFTVKQWIAKDTYFLMKAEVIADVESTAEIMDYLGEEGEMSMDITLIFLAYNYNQPVTIVLPPDAKEAIEMPVE
jgi:hypothetical protein